MRYFATVIFSLLIFSTLLCQFSYTFDDDRLHGQKIHPLADSEFIITSDRYCYPGDCSIFIEGCNSGLNVTLFNSSFEAIFSTNIIQLNYVSFVKVFKHNDEYHLFCSASTVPSCPNDPTPFPVFNKTSSFKVILNEVGEVNSIQEFERECNVRINAVHSTGNGYYIDVTRGQYVDINQTGNFTYAEYSVAYVEDFTGTVLIENQHEIDKSYRAIHNEIIDNKYYTWFTVFDRIGVKIVDENLDSIVFTESIGALDNPLFFNNIRSRHFNTKNGNLTQVIYRTNEDNELETIYSNYDDSLNIIENITLDGLIRPSNFTYDNDDIVICGMDFESEFANINLKRYSNEGEVLTDFIYLSENYQTPRDIFLSNSLDSVLITGFETVPECVIPAKMFINRDFTSNIFFSTKEDQLNIFPNPVTDYLNIDENLKVHQESHVVIFSLNGIVLKKINFSDSRKIFVGDLTPGVYYISIGNRISKLIKL